jgi:hypothetical protein
VIFCSDQQFRKPTHGYGWAFVIPRQQTTLEDGFTYSTRDQVPSDAASETL